jgi:hypothetical protein
MTRIVVQVRCSEAEKKSWEAIAGKGKLSDWLRRTANAMAGDVANEKPPESPERIVLTRPNPEFKPAYVPPVSTPTPLSARWKCKCGTANWEDRCSRCEAPRPI